MYQRDDVQQHLLYKEGVPVGFWLIETTEDNQGWLISQMSTGVSERKSWKL